jgi:diketogulonate reductase-like aldo/keto reductase
MVGKALAKACEKYGVKREDLWITSKIPPYLMDYENGKESIRGSVDALSLGSGYLDLVLIHWPTSIIGEPGLLNRIDTWKALTEMKEEGLVKSIGVSNFYARHLKEFKDKGITPTVNQIEIHPLYIENETIKMCKEQNIQLVAYAPLATYDDRLMKSEAVLKLSEKYGKEPHQIVLRWAVDKGFSAIPKSSKPEHVLSNITIGDFKLNDDEIRGLDSLNIMFKTDWDPKDEA